MICSRLVGWRDVVPHGCPSEDADDGAAVRSDRCSRQPGSKVSYPWRHDVGRRVGSPLTYHAHRRRADEQPAPEAASEPKALSSPSEAAAHLDGPHVRQGKRALNSRSPVDPEQGIDPYPADIASTRRPICEFDGCPIAGQGIIERVERGLGAPRWRRYE